MTSPSDRQEDWAGHSAAMTTPTSSTYRTAGLLDELDPWLEFAAHMDRRFGRRDLECRYCHQRVWMALQGFYHGGWWTSDPGAEGPSSRLTGIDCTASPTREHLGG